MKIKYVGSAALVSNAVTSYLFKGYTLVSSGTFFGKMGAHLVKGTQEISIREK